MLPESRQYGSTTQRVSPSKPNGNSTWPTGVPKFLIPKQCTLEAHALLDSTPLSSHGAALCAWAASSWARTRWSSPTRSGRHTVQRSSWKANKCSFSLNLVNCCEGGMLSKAEQGHQGISPALHLRCGGSGERLQLRPPTRKLTADHRKFGRKGRLFEECVPRIRIHLSSSVRLNKPIQSQIANLLRRSCLDLGTRPPRDHQQF